MRFQFWNMSEDSRIGILLRGSSARVCLVVLNQGCCGSSQCNITNRMLRPDANTTLNQSYVLFIALVNIAYQRGGSVSPFYPFLGQWSLVGVMYPTVFNFFFLPAVVLNCFLCSACISKTHINLTSFLFKSKFICFQICDSAYLLSNYYYRYNCYICFYLLLFFSTCFVLLLFLILIVL